MKYYYKIERVTKKNYTRFEDMTFWRENNFERVNLGGAVPRRIQYALRNPNLYVYAVEIEERYVGWISLVYMPKISKWRGKGHIYVDELWIAPSFRGLGLAKILMEKADSLKEKLGAHGVRLYVNSENETALGFYKSCAYKENGSAVFMEK